MGQPAALHSAVLRCVEHPGQAVSRQPDGLWRSSWDDWRSRLAWVHSWPAAPQRWSTRRTASGDPANWWACGVSQLRLAPNPPGASPAAESGRGGRRQEGPLAAVRHPCAGRRRGRARARLLRSARAPSTGGGVSCSRASARGQELEGELAATGPAGSRPADDGGIAPGWRIAIAARAHSNHSGTPDCSCTASGMMAGQGMEQGAGLVKRGATRVLRARQLACSACAAAFRASGRRTAAATRAARTTPWPCRGARGRSNQKREVQPRPPHSLRALRPLGCRPPVAPQHSRS